MRRRHFILAAIGIAATTVAPVDAKPIRKIEISTPRILLGQIMSGLDDEVAAIDLGPAPRPNGTRVVTHKHITKALADAEVQGVTNIPKSVRIVRKMQKLNAAALTKLTKKAITKRGLKKGITLAKVKPPRSARIAAGWDKVKVRLPRRPRRAGKWKTSALLTFEVGGERVARVAVSVAFDITEEGAKPDVAKGTSIVLTVKSGRIEVSVKGTAVADADIGDKVGIQLKPSGRVVRARLVSTKRAVLGSSS